MSRSSLHLCKFLMIDDILDLHQAHLNNVNIFNLVRRYDKYLTETTMFTKNMQLIHTLKLVVSGHALSISNIYYTACLSGDHFRATSFAIRSLDKYISTIRNFPPSKDKDPQQRFSWLLLFLFFI